ncbi:MAG: hypothetical protein LBV12_06060 [Puniceicoccales bacterium]|nr:hypothetical protein [Puniceicoccales bacterium]
MMLLLAYLAGTNHCAIMEVLCESTSCIAHVECQQHAGKHHADNSAAAHGADCDLDRSLSASPSLFSLVKILLGTGLFLFAFLIWRHLWCISCPSSPPTPPICRPDRLLELAQRWQFVQRAAGFARAPSTVA